MDALGARPQEVTMRYDEFRDRFQDCLGDAGLFFKDVDRPIELDP